MRRSSSLSISRINIKGVADVKFIKRTILFLMLAVVHFLIQSVMMLVSFVSQLLFYEDAFWSVGGMLSLVSGVMFKILSFPFVLIFDKFSIVILNFPDLPYYLNSLLWAVFGYYLIIGRSKQFRISSTRYKFVRG